MKSMSTVLVILALLSVSAARAAVPIPVYVSNFRCAVEAVSLLVMPDGSGATLSAVRAAGGEIVDGTISFTLMERRDDGDIPFPGYPREDIYLEWGAGSAASCHGGAEIFWPDQTTDAQGYTEFVLPRRAGGWTTEGVQLMIAGWVAEDMGGNELPVIDLQINSPDINGDLLVNLADIVLFTQDVGGGSTYRSDFNWDGVVDLSDIVVFSGAIGATCP